jgi:hypothetical protein
MKVKAAFSKFLTNKWVLNIVSFIALLNIIGYMIIGDLNSVIYFIVLALLITYFSKNMIIVLGIPILLVNLFKAHNINKRKVYEGMETQADTVNQINQQNEKSKQSMPITPLDTQSTTEVNSANTTNDESFEVGRKKNGGSQIDYASTIENAYDDLNKILGSDGIKRLTDDTQSLMKQQLQLAEAMKGMGPLIQGMAPMMKQAQDILGGMGDKEGLGNIMDLAKKFTGKQQ